MLGISTELVTTLAEWGPAGAAILVLIIGMGFGWKLQKNFLDYMTSSRVEADKRYEEVVNRSDERFRYAIQEASDRHREDLRNTTTALEGIANSCHSLREREIDTYGKLSLAVEKMLLVTQMGATNDSGR